MSNSSTQLVLQTFMGRSSSLHLIILYKHAIPLLIHLTLQHDLPESLSITQRLASPRPPPATDESLELDESSLESDEELESSDPAAAQNFDIVS